MEQRIVKDLPDTESLNQIVEVKVHNKWTKVTENDKLSWKLIRSRKNNIVIRLFYNDISVIEFKYICINCGKLVNTTTRNVRDIFYCKSCLCELDLSPADKGQDTSNLTIVEVRTKQDKIWHKVTYKDYQIKSFKILKGQAKKHLVYNGLICDKLKYKCEKCGKIFSTGWGKYLKKTYKNLCRICVIKSSEFREKVVKSLNIIMKEPSVRKKISIGRKNYYNTPGAREKTRDATKKHYEEHPETKQRISESVKKIMSLPEVKEKISNRVKESVKRPDVIIKTMLGKRKEQLKKINKGQQEVATYIYSLIEKIQRENNSELFINCIEEYPLAVYKDELNYMIIDICFPQKKIAIEVLGSYWHKPWIEYIKNNISMDDLKRTYKNDSIHFERLNIDAIRDKILSYLNWKILYITEDEVNNGNYRNIIEKFVRDNELWRYKLDNEDKEYLEDNWYEIKRKNFKKE